MQRARRIELETLEKRGLPIQEVALCSPPVNKSSFGIKFPYTLSAVCTEEDLYIHIYLWCTIKVSPSNLLPIVDLRS